MSHENAPATAILDTRCVCCNRPLVDSVSVSLGIGPICRAEYMDNGGFDDASRIEANKLVYELSQVITASGREGVVAALDAGALDRLCALGFPILAAKIVDFTKSSRKGVKATIRITESASTLTVFAPYREAAIAAQRAIPGRQWNGESKTNTWPQSQKLAVWQMLCAYYPGMTGVGPKGTFVVPS